MEPSGEENVALLLRGPSGERNWEKRGCGSQYFFMFKIFSIALGSWQWEVCIGRSVLEPRLAQALSQLAGASLEKRIYRSPQVRSYMPEWKNHRDFYREVGMMSLKWSGWLRGVVYDNFRYSEFLLDHLEIVGNEQVNHVCSFLLMTAIIFLVDPRKSHKKKYSCSHFHGQKTIFISSVEKRTKKSYIPDTWFKEVRPSFRLLIERLFRSSVNDES